MSEQLTKYGKWLQTEGLNANNTPYFVSVQANILITVMACTTRFWFKLLFGHLRNSSSSRSNYMWNFENVCSSCFLLSFASFRLIGSLVTIASSLHFSSGLSGKSADLLHIHWITAQWEHIFCSRVWRRCWYWKNWENWKHLARTTRS